MIAIAVAVLAVLVAAVVYEQDKDAQEISKRQRMGVRGV
jgi:hypothetical protein